MILLEMLILLLPCLFQALFVYGILYALKFSVSLFFDHQVPSPYVSSAKRVHIILLGHNTES